MANSNQWGRALDTLGQGLFKVAEYGMAKERDQIRMNHDMKMEDLRARNNRQLQTDMAEINFQNQSKLEEKRAGYAGEAASAANEFQKTRDRFLAGQKSDDNFMTLMAGLAEARDEYLADLDKTVLSSEELRAEQLAINKNFLASRALLTELHVNRKISQSQSGFTDIKTAEDLASAYVSAGMSPNAAQAAAQRNMPQGTFSPRPEAEIVAEMPEQPEKQKDPALADSARRATAARERNLAAGGSGSYDTEEDFQKAQQSAAAAPDPNKQFVANPNWQAPGTGQPEEMAATQEPGDSALKKLLYGDIPGAIGTTVGGLYDAQSQRNARTDQIRQEAERQISSEQPNLTGNEKRMAVTQRMYKIAKSEMLPQQPLQGGPRMAPAPEPPAPVDPSAPLYQGR